MIFWARARLLETYSLTSTLLINLVYFPSFFHFSVMVETLETQQHDNIFLSTHLCLTHSGILMPVMKDTGLISSFGITARLSS